MEPSPALRELERKILNQDESLDPPPAAVSPEVPGRQRRPMALAAAALVLAAGAVAAFLVTRDSAGGLSEVPRTTSG